MWFTGLIDEEEGAWIYDGGKIRSIVELSRFGYAFNRNIKLSNNNLTAYNLTLGDGHEYDKLAVYIKEDATVSNTQNKFIRDIELAFDGDNKDRFGFGPSGERGKLEFITSNDNADKLGEYITGQETSQQWKNAVKDQISNFDKRLIDINVMPDGALEAFTNDMRIDLLKAIAEKDDNDYFALAARVIKNIPETDIEDFFEKLDQASELPDIEDLQCIHGVFQGRIGFVGIAHRHHPVAPRRLRIHILRRRQFGVNPPLFQGLGHVAGRIGRVAGSRAVNDKCAGVLVGHDCLPLLCM